RLPALGREPCALDRKWLRDCDLATRPTLADFSAGQKAPEHLVYCFSDVLMDRQAVFVLNLYKHIERRRSLAFEHRFLSAPSARFLVRQSHRVYSANQIRQRGIDHQILERVAVNGGDQLD